MNEPTAELEAVEPGSKVERQSFWKKHIVGPVLAQLSQGITPEKIALTLSLGIVLSMFPILGSTTLLCALAAVLLKLNQPIIQLLNWICYPLQIALLIPLYRAGEWLGAPHLALSIPQLVTRFRAGAWQFIQDFGLIALGGIGIWCIAAPPATLLLYFALRPPLRALAARSSRPRNDS